MSAIEKQQTSVRPDPACPWCHGLGESSDPFGGEITRCPCLDREELNPLLQAAALLEQKARSCSHCEHAYLEAANICRELAGRV